MAIFVFVPGAFHGGWCFDLVRPILEREGHVVFTPTLSGVGERSHLATLGQINLDTQIMDIVNLIEFRDLKGIILCGHSYGNMVVTGVADRLAGRIASLVYIDGMIPGDGDTLFSILPEVAGLFTELSAANGGTLVSPPPAEVFGIGPEHRDWVDSKLTPHPLACFTQGIRLTGAHRSIGTKVLIYNTTDIGIPTGIPKQFEAMRGAEGSHVHALGGGHDLMIDSPKDLMDIILSHV